MPMPYELQQLHALRQRGQCPQLPIWVTDRWEWQQRLLDMGTLCIRVKNDQDYLHDWSAIRSLACFLVYGRGNYAELGSALLSAGPDHMETFHPDAIQRDWSFSRLVVGTRQPLKDVIRRDEFMFRYLRGG